MALIKCGECGAQVSTQAKSCPNCGAKVKKPTSIFIWIFLGLIVFGFIAAMIGGEDSNSKISLSKEEKQTESNQSAFNTRSNESVDQEKIDFKLDTVETANCTAAAMKSQGVDIFTKWFDVLEKKYTLIYPDKNKDEIEKYTTERVLDKRRSLETKGFDSKPAFDKYYKMNCINYEPK